MTAHSSLSPDLSQAPAERSIASVHGGAKGQSSASAHAGAPVAIAAVLSMDPARAWPQLGRQDATALAEHLPDLYRQARRIFRDDNDAQDLIQDTCERAVRAFSQFRPGTNLRAWLYTIMVRRSQDLFRARRARPQTDFDPDQLAAPETSSESHESQWSQVSDQQFQEAVADLPKRFRQVFELHAVNHLPYQDIALRLDIPINTVASRLKRAREKLRKRLLVALERREGHS
jgi:RNA polymerase sigma-70 factor (ECF subfamily)